MKNITVRTAGVVLAGVMVVGAPSIAAYASPVAGVLGSLAQDTTVIAEAVAQEGASVMPTAGVSSMLAAYMAPEDDVAEEEEVTEAMSDGVTVDTVDSDEEAAVADVTLAGALSEDADLAGVVDADEEGEPGEVSEKSEYADIAIAQVNDYVNVRSEPNTDSDILGKLYNNSAATVLDETEDGWYYISSGSVTGYVKSEYVVTGDEELAKSVSTRYATVTTTTLNVRSEPTTDSSIIYLLPLGDDLVVLDESTDGWVLVSTEEGNGYVSTDYVTLSTEFVQAESKEEEEARLAKEKAEKEAAEKAASAARKSSASSTSSTTSSSSSTSYSAPSGSNGQAVADYACQFVGNPYVYGGSSLTNGTDCSGFVMSVYAAFGISLPHSSSAMRSVGYGVSLSDAQPGDIVCYSGHVGIYIGNGTIVHASTARTGITYSNVNYRTPICVRRIF